MSLNKIVLSFLRKHNFEKKTLLLGLSGGPDSIALFYLLLACRKQEGYPFAVAHIDHRWRKESEEEAKKIEELARGNDVPFFQHTLDPTQIKGNLEAGCRKERLRFFKTVTEREGYLGVFLAHHADDQAEGVFKKFFEGKSLPFLRALKEKTDIGGLMIFRPFLQVSKNQILEWLSKNGVAYFEDATNHDPKLLRGRLRSSLFPRLKEEFGKDMVPSFLKIARESEELEAYLDAEIAPMLREKKDGVLGTYLDFSPFMPKPAFCLRHLFRRLFETKGVSFPQKILEVSVEALLGGSANKVWETKDAFLFIDRKKVFLVTKGDKRFLLKNKSYENSSELNGEGSFVRAVSSKKNALKGFFQFWTLRHFSEEDGKHCKGGWREAWQGRVELSLPEGRYFLKNPEERTERMSKLWTNREVPAFMRSIVPLVVDEYGKAYEVLSGRHSYDFHQVKKRTRVILEFSSKEYFC